MEAESNNSDKHILLQTARLILSSSDEAIQILSDNSMSNAKSIERNSRSIKDPDPLSSALANNSMKWPITINVDRMSKIVNMSTDDVANWDSRKYRRKQCKFGVVDKWIESPSNISEVDREAITNLFNHKKKRYDEILKVEWKKITFRIMNVSLDRLSIPTNPDHMDIPKDMREDAITQVLCGDSVIEYRKIPEEYKAAIKEVISKYHFNSASIPNLINFIKSHLDPKIRTIPSLPGMTSSFVDISHVLVQPRYKAINLSPYIGKEKSRNQLVTKACLPVLENYHKNTSINQVRNHLENILIYDMSVFNLLPDCDENVYVKSCKALCGLPIKPEIESLGIKMSPHPARTKPVERKHVMSGMNYIVMEGEETISFTHHHSNGSFTHNGTIIYSISMKKTSPIIIREIISKIAAFCKVNIEGCSMRSMKMIRNRLRRDHYEKPWLCIHATHKEWTLGMRRLEDLPIDNEIRIGKLNLVPSIDYVASPPISVRVVEGIGYSSTGQEVLQIPKVTAEVWPASIDTTMTLFFDYLHPVQILIRSINHILFHSAHYLKQARERKWTPPSRRIYNYVEPLLRDSVRETAKVMVTSLISGAITKDLFLFSVLYTFCAEGQNCESRTTQFVYNAKDTISFTLDSGSVVRSPDQQGGTVYGKAVRVKGEHQDVAFMYQGLIKDIQFRSHFDASKHRGKLHSLSDVERLAPQMKIGEEKLVVVQGSILLARKETKLAWDTYNTIERVINRRFNMRHDTGEMHDAIIRAKRLREEDDESLNRDKRQKPNVSDSASIYGSISSGSSGDA